MHSHKHRTTSKSSSSEKSRKTGSSQRTGSSSPTAPASFAQVFGDGGPENPEISRTRRLIEKSKERLGTYLAEKPPANALLTKRWKARINHERRYLAMLEDYLTHILAETPTA